MNNIIFITGSSSDIGVELIKSLKEKCLIIAHYNNNIVRLTELQKEVENIIFPVKADFSDEKSIIKMLDKIEDEIGIPNKIIHLAASKFENIRFKNVNWTDFMKDINISLGSITQILNRFLPKMDLEKKGRVVTILSSVVLGLPPKALTQYTTVKYSILGLMKALAVEYASKKITIN